MFTYFLVGEDSHQRLHRLSSLVSTSSYPPDRFTVKERFDTTVIVADSPREQGDDRGWPASRPGESKRPPLLSRCENVQSCDVSSDLSIETIFPNFRRSLAASSKRRRFRNRNIIDSVISNSSQDCSVYDAATRGAVVRQKDFRIPKSTILESRSDEKFHVIQAPPVETEGD